MAFKRISKSQYIRGLQCPKALWYYRHRPELMPEVSSSQQVLFDAGNEVGKLAQQYFDNGIEITGEYYEVDRAIADTQEVIGNGQKIIFEAAAESVDGAFSRIDILKKVEGSDFWDLIEAKMSTHVEAYHYDDMALQRYAFVGAGYKIRKSILMHINNQYVRTGDLNLQELFALEDCTEQVEARMVGVGDNVTHLLEILNQDKEPVIGVGEHCRRPFECNYIGHCWPERKSQTVYKLFRSGRKRDELISRSIFRIEDVPDHTDMTEREQIAVSAAKSGQVYKDKYKIREFLDTLEYPLYFLDYETISYPIPMFDYLRPYQRIPFQFSLHVQEDKGGPLTHVEYLHTEKSDPRPDFIRQLIDSCGEAGSVVVYNQSFEKGVNDELGEMFPDYEAGLNGISDRMVDIMAPFRERDLYHPDLNCSYSLKNVLPAFVPDMSYDGLEIADGGDASQQYLKCLIEDVPEEEKKKVFENLRIYCGQDTLAEVRLLEVLYGLVKRDRGEF